MLAFSVGKTHMNLAMLLQCWWVKALFDCLKSQVNTVWFYKDCACCDTLLPTATQLRSWGSNSLYYYFELGVHSTVFHYVQGGTRYWCRCVSQYAACGWGYMFLIVCFNKGWCPTVIYLRSWLRSFMTLNLVQQVIMRYCLYLSIQFPTHMTTQKEEP